MTRTHKCSAAHTFEYEAIGKDDPGFVETRIHFDYTPGTPETGRYSGSPENYDPGSGCEIAFDYAEMDVGTGGQTIWHRLIPGEWLDQHCRAWLANQDESDLENDLPDDGPDPDRQREDREERRQMEHE